MHRQLYHLKHYFLKTQDHGQLKKKVIICFMWLILIHAFLLSLDKNDPLQAYGSKVGPKLETTSVFRQKEDYLNLLSKGKTTSIF